MTTAQLAADADTVLDTATITSERGHPLLRSVTVCGVCWEAAHRNAAFLKPFTVERPVAVVPVNGGWRNGLTGPFKIADYNRGLHEDEDAYPTAEAARLAAWCDRRDALLREMETVFVKGE